MWKDSVVVGIIYNLYCMAIFSISSFFLRESQRMEMEKL